MPNSYKLSDGSKMEKPKIDRLIREAKAKKLEQMMDEHGYHFCEECGVSTGTYLDCSHNLSVNDCQRSGRTELAWDVSNLTVLCRKHHQEHENKKKI